MTKVEIVTPDSPFPHVADSAGELEIALKSPNPFIWIQTSEEFRVIADINSVADKMKFTVWAWSLYQGLVPIGQSFTGEKANAAFEKTPQPQVAIEKIAEMRAPADGTKKGNIIVMRDPQNILVEPILRSFRDLHTPLQERKTKIIFMAPVLAHGQGGLLPGLPPTLEKLIYVMTYDLPSRAKIIDEVKTAVAKIIENHTPAAIKAPTSRAGIVVESLKTITTDQYQRIARACQGLTIVEIKSAIGCSITAASTISIPYLLEFKKQILSKSDILEYFEPNRSMSDIGGMDKLKDFFEDYKFSHSDEAREFGLDPLRGVLKVGVPGCGKSQMVKAVASSWQLPLIRLDVGKVMTGLVGGSEQKMRQAIKQVEAISPCILWVDEIEKALSGTGSSNHSDGGTTSRVFGTLLTAMEEGLKGVTILATANDIQKLPPELIRRFSEVFFVDLPGPSEREDIFKIHLGKKKLDYKTFVMEDLVKHSENYTGGEIEKAVARSLAKAFKSKERKVTNEMIVESLTETKPISVIMASQIDTMRTEAIQKYRFASSYAEEKAGKQKKKIKKMSMDNLELPQVKKAAANTSNHIEDTTDDSIDLSDD